jgi:hypothetical protein
MPSQTLIHADIFFFISSIGFVLIALVILVGLGYVVSILRKVNRITEKVETGIEAMEENTQEFISDLRESTVFRMLFGGRKKR